MTNTHQQLDADTTRPPGLLRRHPELRWLAVVGIAVLVAGGVSSVAESLRDPDQGPVISSPAALVALLRAPHVGGYTGTVDSQAEPALPERTLRALGRALPDGALLDGSHTLRYYYAGASRQRISVVRPLAEQDLFRRGRSLWSWDSRRMLARRVLLGAASAPIPGALMSPAGFAPPELARVLLDNVATATDETLRSGPLVADRETYELVLRPTTTGSTISEVDIQVDGSQGIALGVQIYPRAAGTGSTVNASRPEPVALDVSFSSIYFAPPPPRTFRFEPPAGTTVLPGPLGVLSGSDPGSRTVGTGWLRVLVFAADPVRAAAARRITAAGSRFVHGRWGSGRVLVSPLLSVLVTRSGQVALGAVNAAVLEQAIGG